MGTMSTRLSAQTRGTDAASGPVPTVAAPAIPTLAAAINVDGLLDEPGWLDALLVELPWEISPADNGSAPVATRCRLTHDETHLYMGCEARDPDPEAIRAYITDRDDLEGQDRVTLSVDPFGASRRAFEFEVSALGVQSDAIFNAQGLNQNGGGGSGQRDASWDAIWASAGRLTPDGYVVELAIPFKSLRFPSTSGSQTWRYSITREWPRDEAVRLRNVRWDRSDACELCQADEMVGFSAIEPGANVELTPTLTGGRTDERATFPGGPLTSGEVSREMGLSALWAITPNVVLSATANPDFSQVETDTPQLEANARFALFFPERRPFFMEGADLFSTPLQAVFTRSIANPTVGTKLTGKVGPHSFGVLAAQDRLTTLLFPGASGSNQTAIEQEATTGVLRYRRDVGGSGSVGALVTQRRGNDYANETLGVDGVFSPLAALRVNAQIMTSRTEYPTPVAEEFGQPGGAFKGNAFALTMDYGTREWLGNLNLRRRDADFRVDTGFEPQGNLQQLWAFVGRKFWGEDTWFTSLRADVGAWRWDRLDPAGVQESGFWTFLEYQGPRQSTIWVNPNYKREVFGGERFTFPEIWFGGNFEPFAGVRIGGFNVLGGQVDVVNAREGRVVELNPWARVRLGRRTAVELRHSFRRLSTLEGDRIFSAQVSQLRTVYNFNSRMFVRVVLQQRRTERTPALYQEPVEPLNRSLASQILFSYKTGPQSVLFLGYSDGRFADSTVELERPGLTLRNRSFFVKASYAWRP